MWDKLETFYHIAQMKSFSKAAIHLGISQSSLSRSVQNLERQLGCKVFIRNRKGVSLTEKGKVVFETAQQMYLSTRVMKEEVKESTEIEGRIRLSTTYALANYILMDHLLEFKKLHPGIYFEIVCNDSLVDIIQNEVDFAIRPYMENASELEQIPLITLQSHLYASQKYVDMYGEPKSVDELHKHYFVAYSRPSRYPYGDVEWFLKLNPHITSENVNLRVNSVEGVFAAAEKGIGIVSSYDEMTILQQSNFKKLLPSIQGPKYEDYIVYPNHLGNTKKLKSLSHFLRKRINRT